jgi:hypothetical protein
VTQRQLAEKDLVRIHDMLHDWMDTYMRPVMCECQDLDCVHCMTAAVNEWLRDLRIEVKDKRNWKDGRMG